MTSSTTPFQRTDTELLDCYRVRVAEYDTDDAFRASWSDLCRHLLGIGGRLVVPPLDPELNVADLLTVPAFAGPSVMTRGGMRNSCHENTAVLWLRGKADQIGTGYALTTDDGLWRQHSWGLRTGPRGLRALETTTPRDVYVGLTLAGADALQFARQEVSEHRIADLRGCA